MLVSALKHCLKRLTFFYFFLIIFIFYRLVAVVSH